ncbi:MAG: hypothetical protein V4739_18590 [Pseudomonadota bacterium]
MRAPAPPSASAGPDLLASNAFAVLGVTPLDERLTIIEQAEERGLHGDPAVCQRARSDLTNPRTRLQAELGWFPGVEAALVEQLRAALQADPLRVMASPAGLPPLARANLMCAGFERMAPQATDAARIAEYMREFGDVVERLELTAIVTSVNDARKVSGFPEVQDLSAVDEALTGLRKQYKNALLDLLDRMPSAMLVETMTLLVSRATANGSVTATALVDDLVDAYALETQALLETERENMAKMAERLLARGGEGEDKVNAAADQILMISRHWCHIARPIQLSMKARGMSNQHSEQLAGELRELGVALFNKHGLFTVANRMTGLLLETFASVPRAREQLEADALRLREIEEERLQVQRWDAEWRRAISFQAPAGLWTRHPLRIDPEGVSWQGQHLRLSDIRRVRWSSQPQWFDGKLPVGSHHAVDVSDDKTVIRIRMRDTAAHTAFVHSLWRAVCVRLMFETAQALQSGKTLSFDKLKITDDTLVMRAGRDVDVPLKWSELKLSSTQGRLVIESRQGTVRTELPYATVWNAHVLEQLVRTAIDKGAGKLSDYLADPDAA